MSKVANIQNINCTDNGPRELFFFFMDLICRDCFSKGNQWMNVRETKDQGLLVLGRAQTLPPFRYALRKCT